MIVIVSRNPNGPIPVKASTRPSPAFQALVSTIHSRCRGQSVSRANTRSGGAATRTAAPM